MKNYRVKSYVSPATKVLRYVVEMRYMLFFWTHVKDFAEEDAAKSFCNELNSE